MKAYIQIVRDIIYQEINRKKKFRLIKLENFTNPNVYLEICKQFEEKFESRNTNFIAKLSDEKYKYWIDNEEYNNVLSLMEKKDFISKDERLTKWRNICFNNEFKNYALFLMGTEAVEDQGGLEDFYTINPEMIESYVGKKYSKLFKFVDILLDEEQSKIIDKIYVSLFNTVQKDLFNLSNFVDSIANINDFNEIVKEIFKSLYKWWNIPNIKEILQDIDKIKKSGKIDIIQKAYKFSSRTAISKFQTDTKIIKLENDAKEYYEKNKREIDSEFEEKFPGYNSFDEVVEDLKQYIKGINIEIVKPKLFECDFIEINKILNLKESKGTKINPSTPKIYGDVFRAMFLPILIEMNELSKDEKCLINNIDININKINLANTKSEGDEELISKWKCMCRFVGGIEELFNRLEISNNNGDNIEAKIYSETINEEKIYTFDMQNTNELIKSGILKSSSQNDQKSKIVIEYKIYSIESEKELIKFEYEWHIPETELWIYTFNFINGEFEELIQQEKFLPIGITHKLDSAFEVKNEEEFIYTIKDLDIKYKDILEEFKNTITESHIKIEELGKKFVNLINGINNNGLFRTIFDFQQNSLLGIDYVKSYNDVIPYLIKDIKNNSNKELANVFSKSLFVVNNDEIKSKSIQEAMMTPYHPIMFEKIIDRYTYLANGFVEMFNEMIESEEYQFKTKIIMNKFDRFDQLATITSGTSMMIGSRNEFITSSLTYGFYSLYGIPNESYRSSTTKVDFEVEEDFSQIIQNNPISSYISKVIGDYLNTYPSKIDGINVGFINYHDYKVLITGLHDIISKTEKSEMNFKINVYIYTGDYTCSGKSYLKYWLENKFTEDDKVIVRAYLKYIDLDAATNINEYINKNVIDSDIIFINNVLDIKEIYPEPINDNHKDKRIETRYPSVYLPIPCDEERARKVCISQNQFECEFNHTQLMTYIDNSNVRDDKYKVIKKVQLTNKKEYVIEALHEKGNWIVILDENIDTKILSVNQNKIIGFSTGNGYFGEINTAISTKESHLKDLKNFLKRRLKSKFNNWNAKQIESAAQNCIDYAKHLDGAEILKAINPEDESINNYLAYMLTSQYENIFEEEFNKDFYIRKIISLDSHSHLFDNQLELSKTKNVNSRPDFIIVEVPKENNETDEVIKIKIKIIECKLANENDVHVSKAIEQVKEGYTRLSKIWNVNNNSVEKRFWFNQLYRILAYDNPLDKFADEKDKEFMTHKLNYINEGQFDIEFKNYIYTYWLDQDTTDICEEDYYDENISIMIKSFGRKSINKMLITGYEEDDMQEDDEQEIKECPITQEDKGSKMEEVQQPVDNIRNLQAKEDMIEESKEALLNENEGYKEFDEYEFVDLKLIDLLEKSDSHIIENEEEDIKQKVKILKNELEIRKIKIIPNDYIIGPDIVRIRVSLGTGVNFSQIEKYAEEIMLWLSINEKPYIFIADGLVNIDIVRSKRQMIRMGDIFEKLNINRARYKGFKDKFYVLIGEDILGEPKIIDMSDSNSPHLLIAGQTGSGKSVLLNSMLVSIMTLYKPDEVEMILVDPKQVELSIFEESPYTKNNKIATESDEAIQLLDELVEEMNRRYKLFRDCRVKNITDYNKKHSENKEKRILMVFDEYGAMIEESKEVKDKLEQAIKQLSQKARAAGIHMIICTQTPRADIITTTIRNNLTARIALKVTDSTASSLIIDTKGAESLLGKGDMLIKTADTSNLIRTKSPFINEMEVLDIIDCLNGK